MRYQEENELEQLRRENIRLRKAVEELAFLNELATTISSTQSVDKIVEIIVHKCVKNFAVEQGAVMLLDETDAASPFHTMVRRSDNTQKGLPYRLDTQLTGWMLKHRKSLRINDFQNDRRFRRTGEAGWPIHSLLSVPMVQKGRMIGVLTLFNKINREGFSEEEQRLLSIIASQSAQVIENVRLHQREQDLRLLQEEIRLAREIQLKLLPSDLPSIPGYQIAGRNLPANDVGGDYYDFIPISDHCYGFCLGDVSGKGMPAAMLMANLQATLRGQILTEADPNVCIQRANRLIYLNTDSSKFVTLFYGILNTRTHRIQYCNAGHDNPFLFHSNGSTKRLDVGGPVMGFIPELKYEQAHFTLNPCDLLLIYSDGISEAFNEQEEEFGEARLEELVIQNRYMSAAELMELVFDTVSQHSKGLPQMDDMTLFIIKREEARKRATVRTDRRLRAGEQPNFSISRH